MSTPTDFQGLRDALRMSASDLAARLRVSPHTVAAWSKPSNPRQPPADVLERMHAMLLDEARDRVRMAGLDVIRRAA